MLVTITNVGSDQIHIPAYHKVMDPGDVVQTRRSMADIDGDESLKALILAGDVTLAFTLEAGDSIAPSQGQAPLSYNDAGRPAAGAVPLYTWIFNTDDAAPNYSDGTNWRDAAGVIT
jgi:hypothetical protein